MNIISLSNYNKTNTLNTHPQKTSNFKTLSFKGEFGDKFISEINQATSSDEKEVNKIMKKLGIGIAGMTSTAKVRDIIQTLIVTANNKAAQKEKMKEELAEKEEELAKKEEELAQKEKELADTEYILKENEINNLKSAIRVLYKIKDPEITNYYSMSEQLTNIIPILNKHSNKLENTTASTPTEIAIAMQNKDGAVSLDKLAFLDQILAMSGSSSSSSVISAINLVKDSQGNLDIEKSTHFIATLAWKHSTLETAISNVAKIFDMDKSEKAEYTVDSPEFGKHKLTSRQFGKYSELYPAYRSSVALYKMSEFSARREAYCKAEELKAKIEIILDNSIKMEEE